MRSALKSRKGQWMLISAVIVIGTFLSISLVFRDFFVIDASEVTRDSSQFYFNDLNTQFDNITARNVSESACVNLTNTLDRFIAFSKNKLAQSGFFVHFTYVINSCTDDPPVRNILKKLVVASSGEIIYSKNINDAELATIINGI
jgi:hypothetical protein